MASYQFNISGFEYIPLYVESSKLISLYDLMLRWKCDSALKIAHFVHNRNATFFFYGNVSGKDQNDLETIQCFKLTMFRENYENYMEIFNKFFLIKNEVFQAEKEEPWFTFVDSLATIENERISTADNAKSLARRVVYALCSYKRKIQDIRHHVGRFSAFPHDDWLEQIEIKSNELSMIEEKNLQVNYLKEYQGDDFATIGNFEEAKKYVASHPPKNRAEINMLVIKLKYEFQLTHKEIIQLAYDDWETAESDALQKRVTRALQGYSKYFYDKNESD